MGGRFFFRPAGSCIKTLRSTTDEGPKQAFAYLLVAHREAPHRPILLASSDWDP
jgi:hypothetical protein